MIKTVSLKNWSLDRLLRLVIGALLIGSGWADELWWVLGIGAFLVYQGISNTGCQSAACTIDPNSSKKL